MELNEIIAFVKEKIYKNLTSNKKYGNKIIKKINEIISFL
jgi:hypothetical protein